MESVRKQEDKQEQLARIVTKLESTVRDQKHEIKVQEKMIDNQNKHVEELSKNVNDLKEGTATKLNNLELKIEQLNKLSGNQADEIIGLKKKIEELLSTAIATERVITDKSLEIDAKNQDMTLSIGRNQDLQNQNKYLQDYIRMKEREIIFLKSNRKDLCASVKVDLDVVAGALIVYI